MRYLGGNRNDKITKRKLFIKSLQIRYVFLIEPELDLSTT